MVSHLGQFFNPICFLPIPVPLSRVTDKAELPDRMDRISQDDASAFTLHVATGEE
jgi:hypothetical protein